MNQDDFNVNYLHLTPKQKEILNYFATGKSDSEISSILTIETNTVRKHMSDICLTFFKDKEGNKRIKLMQLCIQYLNTNETIPPINILQQNNITTIYGEIPNISCFYGRTKELNEIKVSIIENNLRCLAVVGMGGIGKTTLVAQFIREHQAAFECIIWQDLKAPIKLIEMLRQWLIYLGLDYNSSHLSDNSSISKIIEYLKTRRCLLVLDNVESIMQDGRVGSFYREYEEYGELLRRIREATHQSCLIITSREIPSDFTYFHHYPENQQCCILKLGGLQVNDIQQLYTKLGTFNASESEWSELTEYYGGNPLELRIVATEIKETFQGDISQFIKEFLRFGYLSQIRDLFNAQFNRLSEFEQEVVYWLSIYHEPVTRQQLQQDVSTIEAQQNLIDSISSLRRRSFIEESGNGFTLQPVLMKYATESLLLQITNELKNEEISLLDNYSLIKATNCDYLRNIQVNLFVQPILQRLLRHFGSQSNLEQHLQKICTAIKSKLSRASIQPQNGYAGGNLLNLFRYLGTDLTGYDFSMLTIRQADFRSLKLKNARFNHSILKSCLFSTQLGGVIWVVFSNSGNLLAGGDVSGNVHIWEVVQDKLIPYALLEGHDGWVWSVRFSNDDKFLVSAGDEYNIRIWRLETQTVVKLLEGHTDWIRSLSFNRDGILASASDDKTVKLWNITTGECVCTLTEHKASVRSVSFNQVNNQLASASDDETIIIWDINTKTPLQVLRGHSGSIRSVCFSPNGKLVASAGSDKTVRLWDLETLKCKILTEHSHWVRSVDFSADGKLLLSGSEDQTVKLWDVDLCKCIKTFRTHTSWVQSVRFSADGQRFASGSADRTVKLWDINQGCLNTIEGYTNCLFSIAFSPDGNTLASGYEDRTIRLWDLKNLHSQTLNYTTLRGHTDWVRSVIFSGDGKSLATTSGDGTVRVWDVETGKSQVFGGHTSWIRQVRFSPDNRFLASCSDDCTIKIWNIELKKCVQTLVGHSGWVRSIAFNSSGSLLASAGGDGTIKLWRRHVDNLNNLNFDCIQTLEGHNDWVWWVSFSPDGILVSAGGDGTVRIWRPNSNHIWENSQTLYGHTKSVRTVAFSHDGKIIASGGVDRMLRLWDIQTGQEICQPQEQNDWIRSVAFSTTGYLASASQDGTIRLLHLESNEVKTIRLPNLYEAMDIRDVKGLTDAQTQNLKALGAIVT
ncbi:WD-40 repeat-containing protein [Calothrix sp. NIES-4071]|nr:WD-40 repeat-containing protein [Calothrix sp. NIES-4071]BAZ56801.1 WD-40 repeat-containing protein [Calothrix sp. NIES-4105]